jgi:hypothetical protein
MARCTTTSVLVLLAAVAVCLGVATASPSPPRVVTSTMTGVFLTGGPAGLLNQLPFTLRIDPVNERFRLDMVYFLQTITIMQV